MKQMVIVSSLLHLIILCLIILIPTLILSPKRLVFTPFYTVDLVEMPFVEGSKAKGKTITQNIKKEVTEIKKEVPKKVEEVKKEPNVKPESKELKKTKDIVRSVEKIPELKKVVEEGINVKKEGTIGGGYSSLTMEDMDRFPGLNAYHDGIVKVINHQDEVMLRYQDMVKQRIE
ncbi:MAG: hypothetical protein HY999_06350, partial [Nitrospinae bacterium]|nr:hypothetical protein [Nitrospinota bacterium]